jgi:hypothetical protein
VGREEILSLSCSDNQLSRRTTDWSSVVMQSGENLGMPSLVLTCGYTSIDNFCKMMRFSMGASASVAVLRHFELP